MPAPSRVTGANNASRQVSVDQWNAVVDRLGDLIHVSASEGQAGLVAALGTGAKVVRLGVGTFPLATALDIPSGTHLIGEGDQTILSYTGTGGTKRCIDLLNKSDILIQAIRLVPPNSGTNQSGVFADTCQRITIRDVAIKGQTNANGVFLLDCDDCTVDNLYFDGGASVSGYGAYLAGTKRCRVVNSTAYRPTFGFVIVGQDIQPATDRVSSEAFGNVISNCHVTGHDGHAFDINSAWGNIITGCSAEDYSGVSTNQAFQIKHSSGDNAEQNIIANCTVKDCPGGFGAQQSQGGLFVGCTAYNCSEQAFALNSSDHFQFVGCTAKDFGKFGVWVNDSSARNSFNGISLETSTATATGISLASGSAQGNTFDNVQIHSALAYAIDIAATCTGNIFGGTVRCNNQPVRDLSNGTIWPVNVTTPEIDLSAAGTVHAQYRGRGMVVTAARAVIVSTVGGTPQVSAGKIGAPSSIAAAQTVSGAAGTVDELAIASGLVATGAVLSGSVTATGTGKVFFQFEGLSA